MTSLDAKEELHTYFGRGVRPHPERSASLDG
jgi:hypothetical protein